MSTQTTSLIRIAVADVASELSFESSSTPEVITQEVEKAIASNSPLSLTDIRGHQILVPASKIGYVEIGQPKERRVGFGAN